MAAMKHVLIAFVLVACGKSDVRQCRNDADALATLLREANTDPPQVYTYDAKLVSRTDLARIPNLPRGLELRVGQGDSIEQQRARMPTRYADTKRAYLIIDEDTSWAAVVNAFDEAKAGGITEIGFVFVQPVEIKKIPRAAVDDELDKLTKSDASNKATKVAELMTKEIKSCPSLQKLFGSVASDDGNDKASYLIEGIPEALVECECRANLPAIRSIMYRIIANPTPTRVLVVTTTEPTTKIAAKADTRWKDVQAQLKPDLTSVVLVVE